MPSKTTKKAEKNIANESYIKLEGVSTHNLQHIDIEIPKHQLVTITGVSGSGKSSLAFHTIYKEWQFRYIESLGSYLRQFFNLGTRPDIEHSEWLSPAIAIEQNKSVGNSRSTVGTTTEIDDYLRLLFAKVGDPYCYHCGEAIQAQNIDTIIDQIYNTYIDEKVFLVQHVKHFDTISSFDKFVKKNRNQVEKGKGFTRYLVLPQDEEKVDTPEATESPASTSSLTPIEFFYLESPNIPADFVPLTVYGIYDRITLTNKNRDRIYEDIIKILEESPKFGIYVESSKQDNGISRRKTSTWSTSSLIQWFTDKSYCANCDIEYPDFTTQHFSPNRQEGACDTCHGLGEMLQADFDKLLDPNSSYLDAVLPWRDSKLGQAILKKLAHLHDIDLDTKWYELPDHFQELVIYGNKELLKLPMGGGKYTSIKYKGIEDVLIDQYNKGVLTVDFQAMLDMDTCPSCHGTRLRPESLNVFLQMNTVEQKTQTDTVNSSKFNIADLQSKTLTELKDFLQLYRDNTHKSEQLVDRIMRPLVDRVETIGDLGLGYINLARGVKTLSGGEMQRLRLAKQLGNKLTGIIYVLDEPTIGLDTKEIERMIVAIRKLQAMGNSIIVVEHHDKFIEASDRVVEIGPGAWDFGGQVVFNGPYKDFITSNALTAQYMRGEKEVDVQFEHEAQSHSINIKKASAYNLKSIDVDIPLGSFTIITGPSGAGKTTLMYTTLFRFLNDKDKRIQSYIRLQMLKSWMSRQDIIAAPVMKKDEYMDLANKATQAFMDQEIQVETIRGHDRINNTLYVDQSSIGKTPRSCPATFIGVFDDIRKLYAGTSEAKYLGFNIGHFSFNSKKWRCPECNGYGHKKIELQFLPDTYVPCDLCQWRRYKPEILNIKRRGQSIYQILDMYVKDALIFFEEIDHIHEQLQLMVDIWLGYLRMGQPAPMLSGGESQRLKLVSHLLKSYRGHTLYFLDEPTVGLHPQDIERLLHVLKRFLENGDTIVMIEHDEHLLQFADKVIRLENGKVVS